MSCTQNFEVNKKGIKSHNVSINHNEREFSYEND